MVWAVESGIANGKSATTFGSSDGCTRAQIVTFLYRAQQNDDKGEADSKSDSKVESKSDSEK